MSSKQQARIDAATIKTGHKRKLCEIEDRIASMLKEMQVRDRVEFVKQGMVFVLICMCICHRCWQQNSRRRASMSSDEIQTDHTLYS